MEYVQIKALNVLIIEHKGYLPIELPATQTAIIMNASPFVYIWQKKTFKSSLLIFREASLYTVSSIFHIE